MKLLNKAIKASADLLLYSSLIAASPALILFSKKRASSFPFSSKLLKRLGIYVIPKSYYFPLFDESELKYPMGSIRSLPGVEFNIEDQFKLLEKFTYSKELELDYSQGKSTIFDFKLGNGAFEAGDFEALYQFCRATKPKKVVEVGSGHSTKVLSWALRANKIHDGIESEHVCIEPYENPWLSDLPVKVLRKKVEDIEIGLFQSLGEGDLLFIDSSHVIRPQGDVLFEYLEILPSLSRGVYIHIHDIFSPRDYLESFLQEFGFMWNEQYLVEALLGNRDRYKVILSMNHLKNDYFDTISTKCHWLTKQHEPGSFYLKVI